jgi:phage protein Gp37/Gp68
MAVAVLFGEQEVRNKSIASFQACTRQVRYTPSCRHIAAAQRTILKMLPKDWGEGYLNVWLGITAEDQERFDQRWKHLARVPAAIKFISYEPAIGPLRLPKRGVLPDWLILGGESGPGARPANPQWIRDIIEDCRRRGVMPFHKQWGSYASNPLVVEDGLSIAEVKRLEPVWQGRRPDGWPARARVSAAPRRSYKSGLDGREVGDAVVGCESKFANLLRCRFAQTLLESTSKRYANPVGQNSHQIRQSDSRRRLPQA